MVVSLYVKGVVTRSAPAPVFENKKSNERDFVAFEKKSAFIVVIWRFCNLFTPVVSVGYIFVE